MLFARYGPILFALAIAGSLAGKRVSPPGLGTMRTDNATFVVLLIGVIVLVGALTFFPALLLGPIVQGLTGHLYYLMTALKRQLIPAVVSMIALTLALGIVYPLLITGIGQLAFPATPTASRSTSGGKLIGSKEIGQQFTDVVLGTNGKPKLDSDGNPVTTPDPRYFQSRPSGTVPAYNAAASTFANLGPNDLATKQAIDANAKTYLALNAKYDPGLTIQADPGRRSRHERFGARPRHLAGERLDPGAPDRGSPAPPVATVDRLISKYTGGRGLGFSGEPSVNVLELNLALNRISKGNA